MELKSEKELDNIGKKGKRLTFDKLTKIPKVVLLSSAKDDYNFVQDNENGAVFKPVKA